MSQTTHPAHPARLWKPLKDNAIQCRLCSHFCVIKPGARGLCGVRENSGGSLETLVYGLPAAVNVDPVEKKPLYHFLPGTRTFSFGTMTSSKRSARPRCLACSRIDSATLFSKFE